MTPTQRYLFDLQGYLHITDVLTPEQLASGRAAIDRYIATPDEQLPEGFARSADGKNYENGFAFDKALESLVMHPALWPIIREFTHDKPAFSRGTLQSTPTSTHRSTCTALAKTTAGKARATIRERVVYTATTLSYFPILTT